MAKNAAPIKTDSSVMEHILSTDKVLTYNDMKHLSPFLSQKERAVLRKRMHEMALSHGQLITYDDLIMYSQFVDAHKDINPLGDVISLHTHSFYEMLYICSGSLEYIIGGNRYNIEPGDAIFIPSGVSHRPVIPGGRADSYYERIVLWVSNDYLANLRQILPKEQQEQSTALLTNGFVMHVEGTQNQYLREYFMKICQESERESEGWQVVVAGLTAALVTQMLRSYMAKEHIGSSRSDLIDHILIYIDLNLADKITLEDTARLFGISESTLSKTFRTNLGTSFYQYVTQRRLNESKKLMARSVPISDIAGMTGFNDYTAFYRAFKKEFNISPSEYKQLIAKDTLRSVKTG